MDEVESALTYYERFVKNIPEDKIDAGAGSSNGPGERTSILEMSYKASLQRMDELRKLLFLRKEKEQLDDLLNWKRSSIPSCSIA